MYQKEKYNHILQKKDIIRDISLKLKTEFIGLDEIIDEVMTLLSAWFYFPEAHTRPTIINLWGLTGTGKTALVKRIVELLEVTNSFLHLDMGEYTGESGSWIKSMLTNDLEHFHEKSSILCFDEFQFARSLDNNDNELTRDKMRVLWELFDSGKIYYEPQSLNYYAKRAEIAILLITKCAKKGIILNNGEIVGNIHEFLSIFSGYYFDSSDRYGQAISSGYFLSKDFIEGVKELFSNRNYSEDEIISIIKTSTLTELSEWLFCGIQKQISIRQLDLSKALIFILGNLDEAFYMSHELSPDLSADEFYDETLKINIADIKSALKHRFRNEQIARLGNNHLIYPCFNNQGYKLLIQRNLNRINETVKNQFSVDIHFHPSLVQAIYDEGVFPSQGSRPVLTTIRQMVDSYVGRVVCEIAEMNPTVSYVNWEFQDQSHLISFFSHEGRKINELRLFPKLKLHELRKAENSDIQLHTAIHESGHAIVAALVLRILPSMVVTKTVSSSCDGFCRVNLPERLLTKGLIRKRIMISLSGFIAEKIVLGEENTSTGVTNDIERASELANRAIKEYAMGNDPIRIHVQASENNDLFFNKEKYGIEALNLINECMIEAENLLLRNKMLLLKMSQYLTEHSFMREEAIGEMIKYYADEPWLKSEGFIHKEKYFNFKELVQKQVVELEKVPIKSITERNNQGELINYAVLAID